MGRPVRQRGRGKNTEPGPPPVSIEGQATIGHKTVARYVEALVIIWDRQQRTEGNNAPHPRDGAVKNIIDNANRTKAKPARGHFADKLVGASVEALTSPELLVRMADYGFERNNSEGLRNRAMMLLSHYGMLRSGNLCALCCQTASQRKWQRKDLPHVTLCFSS